MSKTEETRTGGEDIPETEFINNQLDELRPYINAIRNYRSAMEQYHMVLTGGQRPPIIGFDPDVVARAVEELHSHYAECLRKLQ